MRRMLWLVLAFAFMLGCASGPKVSANSRMRETLVAIKGVARLQLVAYGNKEMCYDYEITNYPWGKPRLFFTSYYHDQSDPENCYSVYEDDGGVEIRYLPCADLPKEYCEESLQRNNMKLQGQKNSTP